MIPVLCLLLPCVSYFISTLLFLAYFLFPVYYIYFLFLSLVYFYSFYSHVILLFSYMLFFLPLYLVPITFSIFYLFPVCLCMSSSGLILLLAFLSLVLKSSYLLLTSDPFVLGTFILSPSLFSFPWYYFLYVLSFIIIVLFCSFFI